MNTFKLKLFATLLCLLSIYTKAQSWNPVGGGLYNDPGCMTVYNGDLYVGGYMAKAGTIAVNNIAKWNGTAWSAVGSGVTGGLYPSIYAMTVYNGELYVAGAFDSAGGQLVSNIAKWNGTAWSAIGSGINGYVHTMTIYNGELIIGGNFTTANGVPASNIVTWNGNNFTALGSGISHGLGIYNGTWQVTNLCTYDSVLYATGIFDTAGGLPCNSIAQWNGTAWSALDQGIILTGPPQAYGYDMVIYHQELITSGWFNYVGNNIAADGAGIWNGTQWSSLFPTTTTGGPLTINYSMVYNGLLYAGGRLNTVSGVSGSIANNVVTWNGSKWDTLGSGLTGDSIIVGLGFDSGVVALCVYNNMLYATGSFTRSGSKVINHIAVWDLTTGIEAIENESTVSVYPNPSNGIFTFKMDNEQLTMENEETICVYNMTGQVVRQLSLSNVHSAFSINLEDQPIGIYLYRVLSKNGAVIGSGKLVKE